MSNKVRFSQNTVNKVLQERGLEGKASADELVEVSRDFNFHSKTYISRDELELGASRLADRLDINDSYRETKQGLEFYRYALDRAKLLLSKSGIKVNDQQLLKLMKRLDDGDGKIDDYDLEDAVELIREVRLIQDIDSIEPPPRPEIIAEAEGATADLGRRKLNDTFHYGGGPVPVIFVDADSTLRVAKSGKVSANDSDDVVLLPGVGEKLRSLHERGFLIAIASNQAGIQHGFVSMEDADAALQRTADLVRAAGGEIHYIDYADRKDENRKPNTGMADRLEKMLVDTYGPQAVIDKENSGMIGDSAYKKRETRPDGTPGTNFSNSDRRFAENVGIRFFEPGQQFGWERFGVTQFDNISDLNEAVEPFEIGRRRGKVSPLELRIIEGTREHNEPLEGEELAAALGDKVRELAGVQLPELDGGNYGLQCYMLEGEEANKVFHFAKDWVGNRVIKEEMKELHFSPETHVILTSLETDSEPHVNVYIVDKRTLEMSHVGTDMNLVDVMEEDVKKYTPEAWDEVEEYADGFNVTYHLLKDGTHLTIGTEEDGVDSFDISYFEGN